MKIVLLSFDTELAWGGLTSRKEKELIQDNSNGRQAMKFLLEQLDRYNIPATWGIVGHLLLKNCSEQHPLSSVELDQRNITTDPLYHMPEIVDWIEAADVDHEIAGHSYVHPRYGALSREEAREDLSAMYNTFQDRGINIKSMIHPYINTAHLDLLSEFGISTYSLGVENKARTLIDGILPFLRRNEEFWNMPTVEPFVDDQGLVAIPRSLQLSDERWGWLNVRRLRNGLQADGNLIHLTLHPHNLIYDPFLRRTIPRILSLIASARDAGDVEVMTFFDLDKRLTNTEYTEIS
jgi:peptidoglycan/xylan/chitin deacetylase (PgdA/CDA1 family)